MDGCQYRLVSNSLEILQLISRRSSRAVVNSVVVSASAWSTFRFSNAVGGAVCTARFSIFSYSSKFNHKYVANYLDTIYSRYCRVSTFIWLEISVVRANL